MLETPIPQLVIVVCNSCSCVAIVMGDMASMTSTNDIEVNVAANPVWWARLS